VAGNVESSIKFSIYTRKATSTSGVAFLRHHSIDGWGRRGGKKGAK